MDNLNSNLNYFPFLLLLIFTKNPRKIRNDSIRKIKYCAVVLIRRYCGGCTCIDLKNSSEKRVQNWKRIDPYLYLIQIKPDLQPFKTEAVFCLLSLKWIHFACLVSHEESFQVKSGLQPFQTEAAIHRCHI